MFRIDVRMDLDAFERRLDDLARRRPPFATARALTWTARDARDDVRRQVARRFVDRSKWVERVIQSRPATKRLLVATVGSRDWSMADHEEGALRLRQPRNLMLRDALFRARQYEAPISVASCWGRPTH